MIRHIWGGFVYKWRSALSAHQWLIIIWWRLHKEGSWKAWGRAGSAPFAKSRLDQSQNFSLSKIGVHGSVPPWFCPISGIEPFLVNLDIGRRSWASRWLYIFTVTELRRLPSHWTLPSKQSSVEVVFTKGIEWFYSHFWIECRTKPCLKVIMIGFNLQPRITYRKRLATRKSKLFREQLIPTKYPAEPSDSYP